MEEEEPPQLFLCPISMELMEDPVTVSTGVTYDRRSIQQWVFGYGRPTCPATMQPLANLDLTPNHTLKRVIASWLSPSTSASSSPSTSSLSSPAHDELATPVPLSRMLENLEETPFKVTALKSMRARIAGDVSVQCEFVSCGGIQAVARVMAQALAERDLSAFAACEEAAAVLALLPLADAASAGCVLAPECMAPVVALLQRGGAEARLHAMDIVTKVSSVAGAGDWTAGVEVGDVVKSLLELLADEVSPRLSSRALDVLLDVVERSPPAKAVEVGAVHVLVELLASAADRRDAERILLLLKRLCKCPEGRLAFAEHDLAVAAVAKTMMRVSQLATQLAVKVLWLVSVVAPPSEKVLEDMVLTGAVAKLLGLLHVETPPATKHKTVRMVRINGGFWRQYPCFPTDLRDYLRLLD
ncbi:unnamed protein product [Urochloa decumbens]|uniref:U-box domain-containing protein n=1 Tax=Urochloa decumbens TaxID=240449 RepID=A0ABC9EDY8_9POAL